ncbi:MAG TPA: hypothetical protein VMR02_04790 [Terracidiphilus sp.]|jgi:Flp pilus assembly pilin Flp|nr:hypothetical protein [Terracidiphilus sp.]
MKVNISGIQSKIKKVALADCGQSMTEYALICALLAFGTIAGYNGIAIKVSNVYTQISAAFASALNSGGSGNGSNGQASGSAGGGPPGGHDHGAPGGHGHGH